MRTTILSVFVLASLCLVLSTYASSASAQAPDGEEEGEFVDFDEPEAEAPVGAADGGYVDGGGASSDCADCMQFQRPNPFFGTRKTAVKVLIFAGLAGVFLVLAILIFHGRVLNTPSITGLFGWTFLFVLLGVLLAAFLSFGEESWSACWCRDAHDGKIGIAEHLRQVNWVTWAIIATAVGLVGVTIKAFVKPRTRG